LEGLLYYLKEKVFQKVFLVFNFVHFLKKPKHFGKNVRFSHKNILYVKDFREKYPGCEEYNSKKIVNIINLFMRQWVEKEMMIIIKTQKFIKNIAKNIIIDKSANNV
jgi:hypothetical protein